MKSKIFMSMLSIALIAALVGGATMAWFTDTDNAGTVTMTAGILDIDVTDGLTTFSELDLPLDHMNPGDVYTPFEINIVNQGTKNLAWFGNWTFTPAGNNDILLDAIYIDSMKMEFKSPGAGADWETADQFITAGVGSGTYPDWFNTLAANSVFNKVSLRQWNDNAGMVPGSVFEHMGALKPGYSYKLTVAFGFASQADNNYQGNLAQPITVGFNVVATQVKAEAINDQIGAPHGTNHEAWLLAQLAKQI